MAEPVRIIIKGTENLGVDAPTVEDLLSQVQDLVSILHGVEEAIAGGEGAEIEWRVTGASKNSPLTLEVTPFPKNHATNIDSRAAQVVGATALGVASLSERAERPMYFSDSLIGKAGRIYDRVRNGLESTEIDASAYNLPNPITLDRGLARRASENIKGLKAPESTPYRELGSVEGFISKVELDGYNRPIVWLRSRLDGQIVKCIAKFRGLDRIGHVAVGRVLQGLRIQVFGMVHYKDLEKIGTVEVDDVHVFDAEENLPDIDQIVAPGFTNGVEASEFVRRLREDG